MNDNQQFAAIVLVLAAAAFACLGVGDWHKPTLQERRDAHWNLPRWARGDYPQEPEPWRPRRAFGLEW